MERRGGKSNLSAKREGDRKPITAQVLVPLTRLRASHMINGLLEILLWNMIRQADNSAEEFMCLGRRQTPHFT